MFDSFDIKYTDGLELDGAFSVSHINYGCSPKFHGEDANDIAKSSRKNSITFKDKIDDVLDSIRKFNGTEKNYKIADRIYLWKKYWFDYIEAFDKSTKVMPDSVVTVYIGRHAIELGLKYLIMVKKGSVVKSHCMMSSIVYIKFRSNIWNGWICFVNYIVNTLKEIILSILDFQNIKEILILQGID